MNLPLLVIGELMDWKFGLVTRQVERTSVHRYIIHDFSDGWKYATVAPQTLLKLMNGEKSLLTLNWK